MAAMTAWAGHTRAECHTDVTEDGDFYLTVVTPGGEAVATLATFGDGRALYGPALANDVLWQVGQDPLAALGINLPTVRSIYDKLAA